MPSGSAARRRRPRRSPRQRWRTGATPAASSLPAAATTTAPRRALSTPLARQSGGDRAPPPTRHACRSLSWRRPTATAIPCDSTPYRFGIAGMPPSFRRTSGRTDPPGRAGVARPLNLLAGSTFRPAIGSRPLGTSGAPIVASRSLRALQQVMTRESGTGRYEQLLERCRSLEPIANGRGASL